MSLQAVVITGANRGIGLEFVRQWLSSSAPPKHVIATTRQSVNEELDKLKTNNSSLHVLKLETKDYKQYNNFITEVQAIVGETGIDILINNAGIKIYDNLDKLDPDHIISNFEVNAVAPLMLTKSLIPLLKMSRMKKTIVVNIASKMGSIEMVGKVLPRSSQVEEYAYPISKTALNMITKCLAVDLKADGINVFGLEPGWVRTDMGGQYATLDVYTSVSNMMKTIENFEESMNGKMISYNGFVIPF